MKAMSIAWLLLHVVMKVNVSLHTIASMVWKKKVCIVISYMNANQEAVIMKHINVTVWQQVWYRPVVLVSNVEMNNVVVKVNVPILLFAKVIDQMVISVEVIMNADLKYVMIHNVCHSTRFIKRRNQNKWPIYLYL